MQFGSQHILSCHPVWIHPIPSPENVFSYLTFLVNYIYPKHPGQPKKGLCPHGDKAGQGSHQGLGEEQVGLTVSFLGLELCGADPSLWGAGFCSAGALRSWAASQAMDTLPFMVWRHCLSS